MQFIIFYSEFSIIVIESSYVHVPLLQHIESIRSDVKSALVDDSKSDDCILIIFRLPDGSKLEGKFTPSRLVKVHKL